MNTSFLIRNINLQELKTVIDWAAKEGWNPGIHDAECFFEADPKGFFGGFLGDQMIAAGSCIAYDQNFAFCGLYIVKEKFRGSGYGLKLTLERLKYAGKRITGIDGVIENVTKYEKIGYVSSHKNIRYELNKKFSFANSNHVVDLKTLPLSSIKAFDRLYFPSPRDQFLKCWIHQPQGAALGFIQDGNLHGMGVIRKCLKGYKVGPLFADSLEVAKTLFESLLSKVKEGPIYLDVPEPNKNGLSLVKMYEMTPCFEVMRMYRNGKIIENLDGIFGVTTFELG